jgi:predicted nucleic acid-binding protein
MVLPITIDGDTASHAWTDTLLLARAERLTLYVAAYLELAIRRDVELATLDRELRRAARKIGCRRRTPSCAAPVSAEFSSCVSA